MSTFGHPAQAVPAQALNDDHVPAASCHEDAVKDTVSDEEIDRLVCGLDNLQWGLQVQADIFALGERAIPALTRFLNGPPSQFPEGRVLAAEALGRIGGEAAFQALLLALSAHRLESLEPTLRLAEETVQDAVARQLTRVNDRRAVPALLNALCGHRLVGAGEALVRFREAAALPCLIAGLEDAFKRQRFSDLLLEMGEIAPPYLINTLHERRLRDTEELLPSLERRAEAAKLLGVLQAKEAAPALAAVLKDPSDVVRTEAAIATAAIGCGEEQLERVVPTLLAGLNHPDFLQRERCAEVLLRIGLPSIPSIEEAIATGSVMINYEAVPLTLIARTEALGVLEQLKGLPRC